MDEGMKEQAKIKQEMMNENKRRAQNKVFFERDMKRIQFTNTCWEVQKVQTFKGGPSKFPS